MAKARSRAAARKVKDKWKAKSWYNILAPSSFDNVTVSETLSDDPNKLINRISEVSLQDITNDFRKSHIKLFFKVHEIEGSNAHTQYIGHTLTSDYLRRMIRRKRSKIDGVYDVTTRDGAKIRIKPFATTDRRIQNSQRRIIRETMKKTIANQAKAMTLSEFIKSMIDGKTGSEIYKACKKLYPVKRIEVYKTEVISQPTIVIEEPKKPQPEEESEEKPKEETSSTKETKTESPTSTEETEDESIEPEEDTEGPEEEPETETEEPKEEEPEQEPESETEEPKEEEPEDEPEEETKKEPVAESSEEKEVEEEEEQPEEKIEETESEKEEKAKGSEKKE